MRKKDDLKFRPSNSFKRKILVPLAIIAVGIGTIYLTFNPDKPWPCFDFLQKLRGEKGAQCQAKIEAEMEAKKELLPPEESEPQVLAEKNTVPTPLFEEEEEKRIRPPKSPVSMDRIKNKGCVADGILSGWSKTNKEVDMINRSECEYLHRAIETWLTAPDFEEIEEIMDKVDKDDEMIYGMFIAEAIDTKEDYYYPDGDRDFDFKKMCRPGSKNFWGEHTCKPSFESTEYRKYVRYITEQAIDLGVQSFLFGQIFYQETSDFSKPIAPEIIKEMKEYAALRGTTIVVGAQTNDITDEEYLQLFDYIEGGVGLRKNGTIENGPCFSRWWKKPGDWCWALLWHERFSSKANDVILHLDWSGKIGDDMSTFARMNKKDREKTLEYLYKYFTKKDMGFMMPMLTALPENNGGCYGSKKRYYSAGRKFSCDDEEAINEILEEGDKKKK